MNNKDITNAQTEANIKQSIGDYDFKSLANQYASTPMTRDIREDVPSTPPTERQTLMGVRDKTPENHMKAYITPEEGESYRAFICQTLNPYGYPAKDRSRRLEVIEEPHLGKLMTKIKSEAKPITEHLQYNNFNNINSK